MYAIIDQIMRVNFHVTQILLATCVVYWNNTVEASRWNMCRYPRVDIDIYHEDWRLSHNEFGSYYR